MVPMPARGLRAWIVALVAMGLVGMHHLVVAACHHGASHASPAAVLSMGSVVDHGGHLPADAANAHADAAGSVPAEEPTDGSDGPPGGLVSAAATCLAILLMVVGLVLPQVAARLRRWRETIARPHLADVTSLALRPPDLTLLSVSRT